MNPTWYALLGLSAILGVLVAILVFALLRFGAAARDAVRKNAVDARAESALLSTALEEAIVKLKAQERATAARAEASERLSEQIVASLTSGLIVVDRDNHVQIVNPAAKRMLLLADVEPGADYRQVLRGAPSLAQLIAEALDTNAPVLRRTATVDKTHLGVGVSPLTAEGSPSGAICLFTDLTNIVALEEQLRLKDSLAKLGELTAGLAHEFRNGLATIHGYAHLLEPEMLPDRFRVYVEGIRGETAALGEVVINFLKFARPEPLALAPVDLRTLITRAADDAPTAIVNVRGEFPIVQGDDVLLRQAFSNLFRNSVEAIGASGVKPCIDVRGRIDPASQTVRLDVDDNGPGIRTDALSQVFQPFFTTRPGGTGLGLAIVQKIIVSHNGLISAGNRGEGGATFRITLPIAGSSASSNL